MRNVVPFKAPNTFTRFGIDWTRAAATERERKLREAFLTYESSCGPNGLVSLLLLATVSRRKERSRTTFRPPPTTRRSCWR
jgi:hypothetical protein